MTMPSRSGYSPPHRRAYGAGQRHPAVAPACVRDALPGSITTRPSHPVSELVEIGEGSADLRQRGRADGAQGVSEAVDRDGTHVLALYGGRLRRPR
jgi:hypothetical protein